MSQSSVTAQNFSADLASCITNYMDQKMTCSCPGSERTIYDELEEKDRDLRLAAEIGQALMDVNEALKMKNDQLIEDFQQRIYEMENEKTVLKKKLDAVENDYEMQLQALQKDIVALRKELSCQKNNYQGQVEEKDIDIHDLVKNNETLIQSLNAARNENNNLVQQLTKLEDRMNNERMSMHGHLNQLEVLKSEILCLREEKKQLETRILCLMEERDCLLRQFQEAQQQNADLEKIDKQNRETIAMQEQEVLSLQHTAAFLQDSINHFQKKHDMSHEVSLAEDLCLEKASGTLRPSNIWWKVWVEGDGDMVEMDEDSVMTTMAMTGETPFDTMMCLQQDIDDNNQPSFIRELKVEVVEVYAQMRTICADLSFRYCTDPNKPNSTPDELALVEIDFKLSSLRDTLRELRGLMSDLTAPAIQMESSLTTHNNIEEMRATLIEKSSYLGLLEQELRSHELKLSQLMIQSDHFEDVDEIREMILCRKRDIEQKMTITQSEMEVLTTSIIQEDPLMECNLQNEDNCEYD